MTVSRNSFLNVEGNAVNRRVFSQLLAFGAGILSATPDDAQAEEKPASGDADGNQTAMREAAAHPLASLPVTVEDFIPLAQAKLPKPSFDYITTG